MTPIAIPGPFSEERGGVIVDDGAIRRILEAVEDEYGERARRLDLQTLLGIVISRGMAEGVHIEVSSVGGGVLLHRARVH
jgi:hypothetical protein